jgi:RNA polymerase sigma-70 factor (ECF subfamily)
LGLSRLEAASASSGDQSIPPVVLENAAEFGCYDHRAIILDFKGITYAGTGRDCDKTRACFCVRQSKTHPTLMKTKTEMPSVATGPDSAAWKSWFARHGARLLLFARQQTRTEADAEDVLQDAILRLWKSGLVQKNEEGVEEPSLAAAFTQIRRAAIDQARKNIRQANREQRAVDLGEDQSGVVWFESSLENDERAQAIEEAMKKLPDYYREVLTLKIWGDLTFEQIAETLDIPMNTAASRYRYALQQLRRLLTPSKLQ